MNADAEKEPSEAVPSNREYTLIKLLVIVLVAIAFGWFLVETIFPVPFPNLAY